MPVAAQMLPAESTAKEWASFWVIPYIRQLRTKPCSLTGLRGKSWWTSRSSLCLTFAVVDEASPTKKQIPQNRVKQMMLDYRFTCVTENDAQRLFDEMDVNKDGVIDLADFKQVSPSSVS